jgi:hypothetical protein
MITALKAVSRSTLAWIGIGLILAPSYFVGAAILKYGLGIGWLFDPLATLFAGPQRLRFLNFVITPLLFFGGSLLALAVNFYAVIRSEAKNDRALRIANFLVVFISLSLLVIMTTYGYLENVTHR